MTNNITTTSASARTDVDGRIAVRSTTIATSGIRRAGVALAIGTASWAAANLVWGFTPTSEVGIKATDLTGFLFQLGVLCLVHVQAATRATGVKTISGRLLKLERVLLGLAMLWSLLHAFLPSQRDATWMVALDMFWPISMLGMFFIGIKVAFAGRWRGRARVWSVLAETWAPLSIPVVHLLGHGTGDIFGALHLLFGYTVLGLILATRPDLAEDRG
jgi:hypothetical protein